MATSAEIKAVVDRVMAEVENGIGTVGKLFGAIYEGDDGEFVTAEVTVYEMYLIDMALSGKETADLNYEEILRRGRNKMVSNGNA